MEGVAAKCKKHYVDKGCQDCNKESQKTPLTDSSHATSNGHANGKSNGHANGHVSILVVPNNHRNYVCII